MTPCLTNSLRLQVYIKYNDDEAVLMKITMPALIMGGAIANTIIMMINLEVLSTTQRQSSSLLSNSRMNEVRRTSRSYVSLVNSHKQLVNFLHGPGVIF